MTTTTTPTTLDTLGPEIASAMPGWKHVKAGHNDGCHYLVQESTPEPFNMFRSTVPAIHLKEDSSRIIILGDWPTDRTHGWRTMTPSQLCFTENTYRPISVAMTKEPTKIAAEIQRRFLPAYLDMHARCCERIARDNEGEDIQRAVTRDFAALMGDNNNREREAHASFYGRQANGHVDVDHGGKTGTLEIRGAIPILRAALLAAREAGAFQR